VWTGKCGTERGTVNGQRGTLLLIHVLLLGVVVSTDSERHDLHSSMKRILS
jgi:hypothetical protein